MTPKNELVFFTKNGMIGMLSFLETPEGVVMSYYDRRNNPPMVSKFAPFGDPNRGASFESEIETTLDRGWKVAWRGSSFPHCYNALLN
jgi:hypothetical protein